MSGILEFIFNHPLLILVLIAFLWFVARYGKGIYRAIRLRRAGIHEIDFMGGAEFEEYLEVLFRRKGYRVHQIPLTGDYGGDLLVSKGGTKTVIQAKRYEGGVGVPAVQQAFTAKAYYDADAAMVITNSRFTRQARKLAGKIGVELWERQRLIQEILKTKRNGTPEGARS